MLTLQNQNLGDHKLEIFWKQFWFASSNCNSKSIWICCYNSHALSFDELTVVSSQISYTENHQGDDWKKKSWWINIEFWHILELMAYLEDDLYFKTSTKK